MSHIKIYIFSIGLTMWGLTYVFEMGEGINYRAATQLVIIIYE